MANSKSETTKSLRAQNATRWNQQQLEAGARRVTVLLPPKEAQRLEQLAERHGSIKAAIIAALRALDHV